jgi:tetratricopeptide (TPR) repeat protein
MVANAETAGNAEPKARVFISYSRRDMPFADRLDSALKVRGFEPLIDRTEIYAFEDWWKRLQALIIRADTVVFVISPDAVASHEALKEIEYAASLNKRFAPIVCRRAEDSATPEALRRLNFIFFDDPARFEASVDQLTEALQTDIGWFRKHTEFGAAAHHWSAAGRPGGLLLRSPDLEEAEHWIASRPQNAPVPTDQTKAFVAASRRGATWRRDFLTGSLAAGLVVALAFAGLAYWQQQVANKQRQRADETLAAATKTANSLVFDLADRFQFTMGIPATLIKEVLDRAHALQEQLIKSGQVTPELKRSEAAALDKTVDTLLAIGDTTAALSAAEQARQIDAELLAANPNSTDYQRLLSGSYEKVGDVQVAQGHLPEALTSYQADLTIMERLAKSDPGNADWQSVLSISYEKVGNVQVAQGNLPDALASQQAGLAIIERLAKSDPGNAAWQRALWISYGNIADVHIAGGDLAAGLANWQAAHAITSSLATSDPGNADRQRDLSISYEGVGDVQAAQDHLPEALASYQAELAIMERLVKSDPSNASWQHDLLVCYSKVGDVQVAQGHLPEAQVSYQATLSIMERQAKSDPANADWQRDLAISYSKLGRVQVAQGHLPEALVSYQTSFAIRERLAKSDPGNASWQRDLSVSYDNVGDVQVEQGSLPEALVSYQTSHAIWERLSKSDPGNAGWQRDLSVSYNRVGDVQVAQGHFVDALHSYRNSLLISQRLASLDHSNTRWQKDLRYVIGRIGDLAYDFILARDFMTALAAADQAISLAPDQIWLYTNRAHALMFLGRIDEARALYLKYRDQKDVQDGKSWQTVILQDFAEMWKAGLTNPLISEIEKQFKSEE